MDSSPSTANAAERRYRILVELGHGGTSDVYLAVAHGTAGFNKLVVLKALKRSFAEDRVSRRMFLAEARLSARLNHPNVVQVNEVLEQDGIPVIVMEYLEGRALSQVLRHVWDRLPLKEHLRILAETLHGLHYSHELCDYDGTPLNVVHRDMSPHNVFVTYDGSVKVLDFGLAKIGSGTDTLTGTVRGKLHYMAPEQLSAERDLDRRGDIYAMGVMLWEAAAGRRLWGNLSDPVVMNRVLAGKIPAPSTVRPAVPARLERACMRALSLDPDARFQSAAAMGDELEAILTELDVTTHQRGLTQFMRREFGDLRQSMRKVVEEKLNEEPGGGSSTIRLLAGTESRSTRAVFAASTKTITNLPTRRTPSSTYLLGVGAGAIALALGILFGPRLLAPKQPANPAAAPARETPSPAPRPEDVLLRVTAFPSTAKIGLDGETLTGNPCTEKLAYDERLHVLRVEAPGHVPVERKLRLTTDIELLLTLKASPPPRALESAHPQPQPPVVPQPMPRPIATASCTPPYFIDARGVKKYKPECL
jgi:serine/threonine protein kinase